MTLHPSTRNKFPIFQVVGNTYFEAGAALGAQAGTLIRLRLSRPTIATKIVPFLNTTTGRILLQSLQTAAWTRVPHLVLELQGVAHGANLSYDEIFMLNALDEIESYLNFEYTEAVSSSFIFSQVPPLPTPQQRLGKAFIEHCTDILTNSQTPANGHNEDGSSQDLSTNYFTNVTIIEANERFFAFTYAGTLAGDAYGWNARGLTFSQNAVFAKTLNFNQIPGQISARNAYGARSVNDVVERIRTTGSANSYNLNVGQISTIVPEGGSSRFINIEVDPMGVIGVHEVPAEANRTTTSNGSQKDAKLRRQGSEFPAPPSYYYHVNMYRFLSTPCYNDTSSVHRMSTLTSKYPSPPKSAKDVAWMLGDTSDPLYPIYRNGVSPDTNIVTLTTVVFDYDKQMANIFSNNPRLNDPLMVLPLKL